jgi:hypothetical protein
MSIDFLPAQIRRRSAASHCPPIRRLIGGTDCRLTDFRLDDGKPTMQPSTYLEIPGPLRQIRRQRSLEGDKWWLIVPLLPPVSDSSGLGQESAMPPGSSNTISLPRKRKVTTACTNCQNLRIKVTSSSNCSRSFVWLTRDHDNHG